jgi:hypothetical protein
MQDTSLEMHLNDVEKEDVRGEIERYLQEIEKGEGIIVC